MLFVIKTVRCIQQQENPLIFQGWIKIFCQNFTPMIMKLADQALVNNSYFYSFTVRAIAQFQKIQSIAQHGSVQFNFVFTCLKVGERLR